MHTLNYCGSLCLPEEVEGFEARGIRTVGEFETGFALAMFKAAGPSHLLYASRVVDNGRIVGFDELRSAEAINALSNPLAPEMSIDPDPRADVLFESREDNLKRLLKAYSLIGFDNVWIFSNNGIGRTSRGGDGVLRDDTGVAYGMRIDGNEVPRYRKGLPGSAQNTAHDHMHFLPVPTGHDSRRLDQMILEAGAGREFRAEQVTLEVMRGIAQDERYLPIGIIGHFSTANIDGPLLFSAYDLNGVDQSPNPAGLLRDSAEAIWTHATGYDPETDRRSVREEAHRLFSHLL